MKHTIYTNSTRTLQITKSAMDRVIEPTLEVYSYDTWVADIFLHENANPHIVIIGDYLHYSRTTTDHIKTAISWLIVKYGNPITYIDGDKVDIRLNKPSIKHIKDDTTINGVYITII